MSIVDIAVFVRFGAFPALHVAVGGGLGAVHADRPSGEDDPMPGVERAQSDDEMRFVP
jgi:hypothetical protein